MSGPLFTKVGSMSTLAFKELMQEIIDERLEEKLATLNVGGGNGKKKRAPSDYNIFIGECMKEPGNDMKACVIKWNDKKDKK
jgi:hypothetical protein